MTSPTYRIIQNGYGFDDPMQQSGDKIFSKFGDMIDKMAAIGDSSTKWTSVTTIACSITITVVVLRWLMKKEQTVIQTYPPLLTANTNTVSPISDQHIAVSMPPVQPVVSFSQILGETMERFLEDVARERPIRFSHQDIHELTNNLSSFLGAGGYGDVYKGTFPNGATIAVKVLKDKHSDKKIQEQFMAEVGTLGRTHHANLVRLYGFCFDPAMRALVYEYMENGSLDKLLFDNNKLVPWQKLSHIAIGIAKGLAYLHEDCQQKIIHYDIKPGNVLLDSKLEPKIADFGLARFCNKESNGESSITYTAHGGTVGYTAPEFQNELIRVTNKCDVYSFGVLLLEIIGRRKNFKPNDSNDEKEYLVYWTWKLYQKGKLLKFFLECGIEEENMQEAERMLMVVFLCINNDPNKRPTMSNVVKMLEGEKDIIPPSNPFDYVELSVESQEKSNAKIRDRIG
ncbi:cysteine-rich receptor-like protein kinase 44 [Bidens hawaiensis]|uniref:cysteine-rich receptor-like protein kinase 44 n=1 Tax=Bidens hawaiensis TaxID=980011 RepID=UPI00404B4612